MCVFDNVTTLGFPAYFDFGVTRIHANKCAHTVVVSGLTLFGNFCVSLESAQPFLSEVNLNSYS